MPEDFARIDSETVDVHPQELRVNGASSFEPAWTLPMSPIKVPPKKKKAPRRAVENLVLESTSQRVLLDQFKSCQLSAPRTLSASSVDSMGNTAALLSPIATVSQSARSRNAFKGSIRCGGFS
ncbi:hypothetical protein L917_18903 [Phytophthora nicotianae]|uniref:Uncharacterized protein n=1 Tax=Phytophthora nicotianae TaxID=4792 RepID=W2K5Z7_PHYNI|nr:hypothetical protein L917_18903 [Phytophthora nicotianae]